MILILGSITGTLVLFFLGEKARPRTVILFRRYSHGTTCGGRLIRALGGASQLSGALRLIAVRTFRY